MNSPDVAWWPEIPLGHTAYSFRRPQRGSESKAYSFRRPQGGSESSDNSLALIPFSQRSDPIPNAMQLLPSTLGRDYVKLSQFIPHDYGFMGRISAPGLVECELPNDAPESPTGIDDESKDRSDAKQNQWQHGDIDFNATTKRIGPLWVGRIIFERLAPRQRNLISPACEAILHEWKPALWPRPDEAIPEMRQMWDACRENESGANEQSQITHWDELPWPEMRWAAMEDEDWNRIRTASTAILAELLNMDIRGPVTIMADYAHPYPILDRKGRIGWDDFYKWFQATVCTDWYKMGRNGESFPADKSWDELGNDNARGLFELPFPHPFVLAAAKWLCSCRCESVRDVNYFCQWLQTAFIGSAGFT